MHIQLGPHTIGENQPTYVIAEIGINHNGDEETARTLIDAAIEAGADAVKFQKRHLPSLYRQDVLDHPERFEQYFQYMIPLLKEVELPEEAFVRLKKYCDRQGIEFLCTPFDRKSAAFLADLGVTAFKIASSDLTNQDLIEFVCSYARPLILSTGMSLWEEIETTVAFLQERGVRFALLHCRSVYPVWPREVNLRMINRLKTFGCPVGYSGHEVGIVIPLVAASMGASIIEKHLTLDKSLRGPDHKASLEPYEFKRLVRDIRVADQAIGRSKRFLLRGEVLNRELFGKSLMARVDISRGTVISREMITVCGPAKGISPQRMNQLIGRRAGRHIPAGDFFLESDLADVRQQTDFNASFRSEWGLIARFADAHTFLELQPRVIEFHLAEKDFSLPHSLRRTYDCRLVVHGPEYMGDALHDLASLDEQTRKASVSQTIEVINLTRKIADHFQGSPRVITHPGAMSLNAKLNADALAGQLARSLDEIRSQAGDDIELLLENLPPYPWYFGGQWKGNYFMDADEIAAFCREHDLAICFDLSHAALYCNAKEKDLAGFIKTVRPHIRHIHFADAYGLDGEGMQIDEGDIDLDAIMPLFDDYTGSWVPEIWRGHLHGGEGFLTALRRLSRWQL